MDPSRKAAPLIAGICSGIVLMMAIFCGIPDTAAVQGAAMSKEQAGSVPGRTAPVRGSGTGSAELEEVINQGLKISFSVKPSGEKKEIIAGEPATVRFSVTDVSSDEPVSALKPAVWLDLLDPAAARTSDNAAACREKVKVFMKGSLAARPEVDLNAYYVLSMNEDASISVIDPIVGMKGLTHLYAMITLEKPAEDWVPGRDDRRLFVTMPQASRVAVVDTETFSVIKSIDAGVNPVRIALQPDARYLWVGNDSPARGEGGVTVIDPVTLARVATIPTGRGHHEIAFSADSLTAFITNRDEGYVSLVDVQTLRKITDISTAEGAVSLAVSALGNTVYVAHKPDGIVSVIDTETHELITRISLKPGLSAVRFASGDRWGFVLNTKEDTVEVIDASMNRVIQTGRLGKGPDKISFTDKFAYIQLTGTPEVAVIPLSSAGTAGDLPVLKVVAGDRPPGESRYSSPADTVVPAGEYGTVLITNPADGLIYYYMEGMEVAMGSFRSIGRTARAAMAIGRGLRETGRGIYTANFRVPKAGRYEAALLLDSPRVVACFGFIANPNPLIPVQEEEPAIMFEPLQRENIIRPGEDIVLRFRLTKAPGNMPVAGIGDLTALVTRTPGSWKQSFGARDAGSGVYEIGFRAPQPGVYYIFFSSRSLKLEHARGPYFVLYAEDEGSRRKERGK